jgi:hypothetical protein
MLMLLGAMSLGSCDMGEPAQPTPPPADAAPSSSAQASIGRGLRRLSRREYNNVARDLLGDTTRPADRFGLEVYVNGFDNGSDGLTVQDADVDAFQAAAEALAAQAVSANLGMLIGACDPQANEAMCVDAFLASFLQRAYRRPPSDGEQQRLRAVYDVGAAAGGFKGGLQLMLEAVLQSPAFLYRQELGATDATFGARFVRLTDYEVASELSFLITGSMPDAELFAAAAGGTLKTADDLRREATRLLGGPTAQPALRSFLHQWLATDQLAVLAKDAAAYPTFNPTIAASMVGELDRYFDSVLWTGSGSFRELLTSTQGFVDAALAQLYGVPSLGQDFAPVSLDGVTRQGVLTRAGYLAVHADSDSSGPVPRGVFVLGALLCEPPAPPPANVPAAPPQTPGALQTTRQRFDRHLNEPFCDGCHAAIDGVGFGFEQFDGIGAFRTSENGLPVDSSGNLLGTDVDGPFVGGSGLAAKLVTSRQALDCFVKHFYRFAIGQEENDRVSSLLARLDDGMTADRRLTDMFLALVTDPAFVVRSTGGEGAP